MTSSVKRSLEGNVASAVKKSKNENRTFSRAFSKDAYEVNNRVTYAIDKAGEALEANSVEEVKEALKEGERLLQKRQKHILIANREECGWKKKYCISLMSTVVNSF